MDLFVFLRQVCVTGETFVCQIVTDQALIAAGMGRVTATAISLGNGGVDYTFAKFFFTLFVAGVAECTIMVT